MKVGEFFVDLGINATKGSSTLKDFAVGMMDLKMSSLSVIGALGTVGNWMIGAATMSSAAAVNFQKFSNQTGLSAQELQRWQIVAKQANVSAEDIANGVFNLQMNLAALARGEGDIKPFQQLRVSPMGDAFDVIERLRKARGRTDPSQFTAMITAMGLSRDWINVFKMTNAEFQQFKETAHGMSPQVETDTLSMTLAFNTLWLKIKDLKYEISGLVSPATVAFFNQLSEAASAKSITSGFMKTLIAPAMASGAIGEQVRQGIMSQVSSITNHIMMTVNGDTGDKNFAQDVSSKIVEQTEAQMPVNESSRQGARRPAGY